MNNIDECVVCYEKINYNPNITYANCIHGNYIHANCILQWTQRSHECPMCRSVIFDNKHTRQIIQYKIDYNIRH